MIEKILLCPCCGEQLKIVIDGDGQMRLSPFDFEAEPGATEKLASMLGLEFGVIPPRGGEQE